MGSATFGERLDIRAGSTRSNKYSWRPRQPGRVGGLAGRGWRLKRPRLEPAPAPGRAGGACGSGPGRAGGGTRRAGGNQPVARATICGVASTTCKPRLAISAGGDDDPGLCAAGDGPHRRGHCRDRHAHVAPPPHHLGFPLNKPAPSARTQHVSRAPLPCRAVGGRA